MEGECEIERTAPKSLGSGSVRGELANARSEILQLYSNMIRTLDASNAVGFAELFAPGATLYSTGRTERHGRREIEQYIREYKVGRPRHFLTSPICMDPVESTFSCRAAFCLVNPISGRVIGIGNCDGTVGRQGDGATWWYESLSFDFSQFGDAVDSAI